MGNSYYSSDRVHHPGACHMSSEQIRFKATDKGKSAAGLARLLKLVDGRELWIPESQLLAYPGNVFSVPYWLAKEKGISTNGQ